jgi:hypothetical protein
MVTAVSLFFSNISPSVDCLMIWVHCYIPHE